MTPRIGTQLILETENLVKLLYVGDSGALLGPLFIASPFLMEIKGFNVHIWGQLLIDGLSREPDIDVKHMSSWEAFREFPRTAEAMAEYDVILLSDIEADVLLFYPEFYTPAEYGRDVAMPNRIEAIKKYVEKGGALIMAGSWVSFAGRYGHAGWRKTAIADALPVGILVEDDRVEVPEGVKVKALNPNHPVMSRIPWDECPPFLGYNKTSLKNGAQLLATIGNEEDPFIVVWDYKEGRVMAFTSDPCPHWGINFQRWDYYQKFWVQAVRWLALDR